MPTTYDNVIAITSQVSTIAGAINRTNIPYSTIVLVPNIQHRYQLEVERIFTYDLNGLDAGALVIKQFLEDPLVNIEVKRNLFIIPATYITSYNESTKQLTIVDLAVTTYTYVVTGTGYAYSIPVPSIGSGDKITVRRKTISNTPLVSWTAGTKLTSNQLNLMTTQLLYLQQEVLDRVFYQAILSGDAVTALNSNSVSEEKLTANAVSTSKIQDLAVTNNKIALGEITYDRINTTDSPWAVDLGTTQSITGTKTFSSLRINSSFIFNQGLPSPAAGDQYILAYNGDGVGGIAWALNNPWNNLPSYVLKTDTPQTIIGNKTFGSATTTDIQGTLKISGQSPAAGEVLTAVDNTGATTWTPVVTGIYTPQGTVQTLQTGTVTITPDSIGALSATGGTVTGNVFFNANVNLGNGIADDITVNGTFKYIPDGNVPPAGRVLMTNSEGIISCEPQISSGVTGITMGATTETTSTVSVTADKIGAVSLGTNQTITGNKTFSGNTVIGDNYTDTVVINGSLTYLPTGQTAPSNGMVLMANGPTGSMAWQNPDATGFVTSINGSVGSIVSLTIPTEASILAAIPTASSTVKGLVQVASGSGGLKMDNGILSIDPLQAGTLQKATANIIGGIRIGSGLTINAETGVTSVDGYTAGSTSVNSFAGANGTARTGAVTAAAGDYTATPAAGTPYVTNAVDTITAQNITSIKTFKANQIITALSDYSVASSGKYGISLDTTGQINAQRQASVDAIFKGYSSGGATTSYIDGFGNSFFSGTVSSDLGFITTGGVTLGDTTTDSIILNGTIRIPPNAVAGRVLTCTSTFVADTKVTGSISGSVLTVTAVDSESVGILSIGKTITGSGIASLTKIVSPAGTGAGGVGTYNLNKSQTVSSTAIIAPSIVSGTAEWQAPSNAPVTTVNSLTGSVKITTENILGSDLTTTTPVVSRGYAETITGTKTFGATTTGLIVTNAAIFNGNVTLGTNQGNTITINSILNAGGGLGAGGPNKVLACDGANQISLQNQLVQSVRGTAEATGNIGEVVLTAANVGAASLGQLATTDANVAAAQSTATAAASAAATAQSTANGKLSTVSTQTTTVDSIVYTTLTGSGTSGSPLGVLRAPPCGTASGDLTGTYPSPTVGANKITYAQIQQVSAAAKLLGGPRTAAGNVVEIGLGTGLGFNASTNNLECTITSASALLSNGISGTPQTWSGYNSFTNATLFGSTISATGSISSASTIGSTGAMSAGTTLTAGTTVTAGTGLTVTSGGIGVTAGGLTVSAGDVTISNATVSSSTATGALKVTGGVGIGGATNIGGVVKLTNDTDSTTSSTGALQVAGGIGIAKNLSINGKVIGGNPTTYGSITVTGSTGTWSGIQFPSTVGNRTLMVRNSDGLSGVFDITNDKWDWYFSTGTGTGTLADNSVAGGALVVGTVPATRITGVLPVANGGTGSNTGSQTTTVTAAAGGTTGFRMLSGMVNFTGTTCSYSRDGNVVNVIGRLAYAGGNNAVTKNSTNIILSGLPLPFHGGNMAFTSYNFYPSSTNTIVTSYLKPNGDFYFVSASFYGQSYQTTYYIDIGFTYMCQP